MIRYCEELIAIIKGYEHYIVGVGWDPVSFGSQMDVDSSAIVAGNKERDVIYFGNLNYPYEFRKGWDLVI